MFKGFSRLIVLIFAAGTCLLTFFIILGATQTNSAILQKFWWIRADTSSITGAGDVTQWSLWNRCEMSGSLNSTVTLSSCTRNKPAYPFAPKRNFDTTDVPSDFISNDSQLYLMSRFLFPLFTVGLFFEVLVLFSAIFTSFRPLWAISQIANLLAFAFIAAAASLATVTFVKGRKFFKNDNADVTLGKYNFGFAWASVFMTLCNVLLLCCAGPAKDASASGEASGKASKNKSENTSSAYGAGGYASEPRGSYRFGVGSRKTTSGAAATTDDAERSSYIHV